MSAVLYLHGYKSTENVIDKEVPKVHVVVTQVCGSEHVMRPCNGVTVEAATTMAMLAVVTIYIKITFTETMIIYPPHSIPLLLHLTSVVSKPRPGSLRQLPEHKLRTPSVT